MYAMGSLLLAKDDLAGAVKMAEDGLSKYPQSLPVQTLSLNTITTLLDKTAWKTRNALSPNIPERPPASSSSREPWPSARETTLWRRASSGKQPGAPLKNGGKRPVQ